MNWLAYANCALNRVLWTCTTLDFWRSLFVPPLVVFSGHQWEQVETGEKGLTMVCALCGKAEYWRRPD